MLAHLKAVLFLKSACNRIASVHWQRHPCCFRRKFLCKLLDASKEIAMDVHRMFSVVLGSHENCVNVEISEKMHSSGKLQCLELDQLYER